MGLGDAPGAFPSELDAGLYDFDAFLRANRYPSSGQARGHASLENAIKRDEEKHVAVLRPHFAIKYWN
jgi:hypothetical protein